MLILHEIGHTLGLTHNMRASQLQPDAFDEAAVAAKGCLVQLWITRRSMSRHPVKRKRPFIRIAQVCTTIGRSSTATASIADPAAEQERLQKLLARSVEPELAYGNDADDMRRPVVVLIRTSISMTTAVTQWVTPSAFAVGSCH